MAKKNISKVLNSGSPTQRMKLLAEDIARGKFNKERLLSDAEFNALSDSFKKPQEIRVYNRYSQADRTVTNGIMNLQGLKYEVLMHYSNLRGYILVWQTMEEAELLANGILNETKDLEERKRIAEVGKKGISLLFTNLETDQEGYLDIQIDFDKDRPKGAKKAIDPEREKRITLWGLMNNVKAQAIQAATDFTSWRKAILDYMDEENFNIKTYKEILEQFAQEVYSPPIQWTKYDSDVTEFIPDLPRKRADNLKGYYAILPKLEEITEVDEERYNWFRSYILENG
jgi:hypothetical protein